MKLLKTKIVVPGRPSFIIYHNLPEAELEKQTKGWLALPAGSKNPKALIKWLDALGWVAYTEQQYKSHGKKQLKPFIK